MLRASAGLSIRRRYGPIELEPPLHPDTGHSSITMLQSEHFVDGITVIGPIFTMATRCLLKKIHYFTAENLFLA